MALSRTRLHPRDRFGLAAYYFLYYCGFAFIGPFMPLYWQSRGFSFWQIGLLLALMSAPGALVLVFVGALSDRWRTRRPFIAAGSSLAALCYALYPHAGTFGQFAILQVLIGVGATTSVAVASALGADVFPPDLAARSFAAVRSWGTVGFILMMAVIYLRPGMTGGTRFFYLTALFHLASIMGTLVVRRERPQAHRKEHPLHGARQLLASPNVLAFVVAFFLSQFALMSSTANMSLYLSAFHPRPSPGIVPLSYGIAATVELPFLMAMGWAADRFGRTLTLAVAFIVLPLRLVAYYLAPTATVAVALQALHGLTFSVLAIVPFAFIADVTPPRYNATGQAVLHAATTAALAVGPAAAGAVAAVVGIRTLYLWLAVAAAAGSVIFFALVREPVRQPAPGPQRT